MRKLLLRLPKYTHMLTKLAKMTEMWIIFCFFWSFERSHYLKFNSYITILLFYFLFVFIFSSIGDIIITRCFGRQFVPKTPKASKLETTLLVINLQVGLYCSIYYNSNGIEDYTKVQADIEKWLSSINSTQKMGEKTQNKLLWTIKSSRSHEILKSE
jgi:exosortase/archaeosortase